MIQGTLLFALLEIAVVAVIIDLDRNPPPSL